MNYKKSIWAEQILALQQSDGSWGHFHTLSRPVKEQPITTEQAMRRLRVLGFSKEDEPIRRVMCYMEAKLADPAPTVFHEKKHDSKTYGDLMLAAWLRLFDPANAPALAVARQWAQIIEAAFAGGAYDRAAYVAAYEAVIGIKLNPKAGCLASFVVFYQIALLQGVLLPHTESRMLDYVLSYPNGIAYIYDRPLCAPPEVFASRKSSWYLAAIELLAGYAQAAGKLSFVAGWLRDNRGGDGLWDMGAAAKDGVYYPLSDTWRRPEDRKLDCTYRIKKLLNAIEGRHMA